MSGDATMRCAMTDAVVARHLDGDVADGELLAEFGWQPGDFLGEHLRDCAICRRELQRCRRLDAALAEASGRATSDLEGDPDRMQGWIDRTLALAAPTAPAAAEPAAPRRSLPRQIATASTLLALGFALACWLTPAAAVPAAVTPPAVTPPAVDTPAAAPAPAAPTNDALRIGFPIASWRPVAQPTANLLVAPHTRADAQQLGDLLGDRALADRLQLGAALHLSTCGLRADRAAAERSATTLQQRASQLLLDGSTAIAFDVWVRAVASLDAGPVLDAVLAEARTRAAVVAQLGNRLGATTAARSRSLFELATLAVAARLGGRDLDAALRQVLRRLDAHEELAAALRLPCARPGRTALLLDVWADAAARGHADELALARTLFLGQPAGVAADLAAEVHRCRQTQRRVRCLLALGVLGQDPARDTLVAALKSPSLPEALAAGFALSQLPHEQLRPLLARAGRGGDAWLLRAALCGAGLPEALDWLADLQLTPVEHELLERGGGTFAQFPAFASLLRDRGPATY